MRNDAPTPFSGRVELTRVELETGVSSTLLALDVALPAGPASIRWFSVPSLAEMDATRNVVICTVTDGVAETTDVEHILSQHVVGLAPPKDLRLRRANVRATVVDDGRNADDGSVEITISADAPALYVMLTTQSAGRFSRNAFAVVPSMITTGGGNPSAAAAVVRFVPWGELDEELLRRTLRVEDLSLYLAAPDDAAVFATARG